MFRRKEEESLFGNNNNVEAGEVKTDMVKDEHIAGSQPSAATNQSAPAGFGVNNSSAAGNSGQSNMQAQPRHNVQPPTANSFRPNAPSQPIPAQPIPAQGFGNRPVEKQSGASSSAVASIAAAVDKNRVGKRVLTVGNDILLKGEIATCDRLVIEGKVDATLNDVHTVEISECGSFKGSAQIENAEIRGLFEGELTVRGLLVIYATGKVRGKITYGEIEIERGGEFSGEIKMAGGSASTRSAVKKDEKKDDKVAA